MKSIKSAFNFVGNCVMPKFNKYVGYQMFLDVEMILTRTHQIYCVACLQRIASTLAALNEVFKDEDEFGCCVY